MNKQTIALALLLLATGALLAAESGSGQSPGRFFDTSQGNLQGELEKAAQAGKKGVLVMFGLASGCGECEKVKTTLLKDPAVQQYYREHFRNLSINVDETGSIIDFKGRKTTGGEFASTNRVAALPTFIFYDHQGYPVSRFVGAAKDTGEFLSLGRYVAEAAYEQVPFSAYKQTAQ